MADQNLRYLKRKDLIDLLYESEKNNEELRKQLEEVQNKNEELSEALKQRKLEVTDAGNLADAVLKVNGVYEAAQAAAQDYLMNIRTISEKEDQICAERDAKSQAEAAKLLKETSRRCNEMLRKSEEDCWEIEQQTKENCEIIKHQAKKEVESYWAELTQRLEKFYESHKGMKEMFVNKEVTLPGAE